MLKIEDFVIIKCLGRGTFGEVFLSTKKGKGGYYAIKKIDRSIADNPNFKKYFENEIKILSHLNHPNIVKLEAVLQSHTNYFVIMEYINGGGLSECLHRYMSKYHRAFPEEVVQHLMRQIIEALLYIHSLKIIHRDLKLDNIMVNFNSIYDKEHLNMMNAKIKIIDFGFAIQLLNANLTFSAVGSPINMDPIILKKFLKTNNNLGYDEKADIWSLGTVCYELLSGKALFNAKNIKDLVVKVEHGLYSIPKTFSKEVISFLTAMLQYDAKNRLSSKELLKHPFLTKNVKNFTKLKSVNDSKKVYIPNFTKTNSDKYVNIHARTTANSREGPIPEERYSPNENISKNNCNIEVKPFSYKDHNANSHNVGNSKIFHRVQTTRAIPLSGKQSPKKTVQCFTPNRGEIINRPNYMVHTIKLTKKALPKMEIQKPSFKPKNVVACNSNTNMGTHQKNYKSNHSFNYDLGINNNYIQQPLSYEQKKPLENNDLDDSFCCIY